MKYDDIDTISVIYEAKTSTVQLLERVLINVGFYLEFLSIDEFENEVSANNFSCKLLLFVRSVDPKLISLVKVVCERGIPFSFYIDDNFWEICGDSALAKYYQHPIIQSGLRYMVTHASSIICNSGALAEYIKCRYANRVFLVPAMFDFSLVDNLYKYNGTEVRIGFAGSESRKKDIEFLADVIPNILSRYSDVIFEFAGVMPDGLNVSSRVRYFKTVENYSDYIRFQFSRGWVIGLAPLLGNPADSYKTNNKFREYSACYTAGIYSDSLSYRGSLVDKINGFICHSLTPSDWILAISILLDNPELRERVAIEANKYVRNNYDINVISFEWHQALLDSSRIPPKYDKSRIERLTNAIEMFKWKVFLYKLRAGDVYAEQGVFGLCRHVFKFLFKKLKV